MLQLLEGSEKEFKEAEKHLTGAVMLAKLHEEEGESHELVDKPYEHKWCSNLFQLYICS